MPFSQINIFLQILGVFLGKNEFLAKKHFSAKRKSGRFSVVLAGTRSVVIVGHFFDGPNGSTKFRWRRSKIKGTILAKWEWPEMAKNRGEPWKMTKNNANKPFSPIEIWIFGPKTAKFGPKLAFGAKYRHFWPIRSHANEAPRWSFCYVGTRTFASSHKEYDFWPKNGQIWLKICFLWHI